MCRLTCYYGWLLPFRVGRAKSTTRRFNVSWRDKTMIWLKFVSRRHGALQILVSSCQRLRHEDLKWQNSATIYLYLHCHGTHDADSRSGVIITWSIQRVRRWKTYIRYQISLLCHFWERLWRCPWFTVLTLKYGGCYNLIQRLRMFLSTPLSDMVS